MILVLPLMAASSARASFGIAGFTATATSSDGSVDLQAGSHPYAYTLKLSMNLDPGGNPEGTLGSFAVDLPPGLVGGRTEIPTCRLADFEERIPRCPGNTQVGVAVTESVQDSKFVLPIYNLNPPPGAIAAFGFAAQAREVIERVELGSGYRLRVSAPFLPDLGTKAIAETIWGVPAAPGHDGERTCIGPDGTLIEGCPSEAPRAPLLTLPTSCDGPIATTLTVSATAAPGSPLSATALSRDEQGNAQGLGGCDRLPFDPSIAVEPGGETADSPTGLRMELRLPQAEGAQEPVAAQLRDAVIRLPTGMAIDPSAADGLLACSSDQGGCPDEAVVGSAEIQTPLLEEPLHGRIFVATPYDNPFGSLVALYVIVEAPLRGVRVTLAGRVELDPVSGQMTVIFPQLPQLPLEAVELDFLGGPRGLFSSPQSCDHYRVETDLTPWTSPEGDDAHPFDSFAIGQGAAGAPCTGSEAQAPDNPDFEAGARDPIAGAASPFVLRLSRENGSQRLRGLTAVLPPGSTGRIAGLTECSEPQLSLGACPMAGEVGTVTIGAGVGAPLYLSGHAYLAGPYKGAPLSLAIVVPAVAGPFDLGTVVVRAAMQVNRRTAQLTLRSDPFPTILRGIPLGIRSIEVEIDRQGLTRNPTSCEPMAVTGEAISAAGRLAPVRDPFQVGACRGLGFRPKLAVSLLGPTHRGAHPTLRAVLRPRPGDAHLRALAVDLPGTELLDSRRIRDVCARAAFAAGDCPRRSADGWAEAQTPLLDRRLAGPVYLIGGRHRLPDLGISLGGQVPIDLVGRLSSRRGRLRVDFGNLPDAALGKFVLELRGGPNGLLVNTGGVCSQKPRLRTGFTAHNGRTTRATLLLRSDCTAARR